MTNEHMLNISLVMSTQKLLAYKVTFMNRIFVGVVFRHLKFARYNATTCRNTFGVKSIHGRGEKTARITKEGVAVNTNLRCYNHFSTAMTD